MATKTTNPSDSSSVEEENKQLQTPRLQNKRTNTTNANEARPTQPLGDKEVDGISRASSPTGSAFEDYDANGRQQQNVDFIDSLDEREATERLDQLANSLDGIDPVLDHGYNESSENLDLDVVEPHIEGEDKEEIPRIDQTGHDSDFLKCRGGLADSASQLTDEDHSEDASEHQGHGILSTEEPDLTEFIEYTPERYPSPNPSENETNEYPWRTWSEDSTCVEAPSVHEDNASQHSQETESSGMLSGVSSSSISSDDEDENEEPQQTGRRAVASTDRIVLYGTLTRERHLAAQSQREELIALGRRLEAEERREELRALAAHARRLEAEERREELRALAAHARRFEAEDQCHEWSADEDQSELPDYGEAIYTRDSPEPPPPPYDRTRVPTQTTPPPQEPTQPQPHPQPHPRDTLQTLQRQTRTDLPAHVVLQALALVGEDSLRSLPTEVLALLGGVEVVGRGVLREAREVVGFLLRRREGGENEGEGR
ncbi:MAG: hypothetical protein L6R42_007844 [Xanthoria sp. 1 TBL-2021]|nr:MAG: hypothetical protein L6R42_007844 [Xanthoria sp. 1 TBL-2021]